MKKLVLTACALTFAVSVFAQGTVVFNNRVVGTVVAPIYGPQLGDPNTALQGNTATGTPAGTTVYTGAALLGTGYTAELWGGPANTTDASLLVQATGGVATFRTATAGAGFWTAPTAPAIIPGVATSAIATLQVRVWDNSSGTSYANATIKGASALFQSGPLGGGINTPPNLDGLRSFNLTGGGTIIPEPSSFALAGLGAAALLIFRRRS